MKTTTAPAWVRASTVVGLIENRIKTLKATFRRHRINVQFAGPSLGDAATAAENEIARATKEIGFLEKELERLKSLEGALAEWERLTKALAEAKANIGLIRGDIDRLQPHEA